MSAERSAQISIIVPVYKVEPYLRCCIDSILAQTFRNFELILVDDGSPDNCGAICDEYAAKDDRVVVIHQENGGLSAARNTGLDWVFANSNSQWISFVDSDDVIVDTCLEYMYRCAVNDADVVTAGAMGFSADRELTVLSSPSMSRQIIDGRHACERIYSGDESVLIWACGKLISRSIICNIRFPVGKIHEDQDVIPKVLFLAKKVAVIHSHLYCYRKRDDSITGQDFTLRRFDNLHGFDSCIRFFKMNGDEKLAMTAEKQKRNFQSQYIILAWKLRLQKKIPREYRMPLLTAVIIAARYNLKRAGLRGTWRKILRIMHS